jgi:hypothetical protein
MQVKKFYGRPGRRKKIRKPSRHPNSDRFSLTIFSFWGYGAEDKIGRMDRQHWKFRKSPSTLWGEETIKKPAKYNFVRREML